MGGFGFPTLDQAIASFEGFGNPGTIATRQNNPGDLMYGPFAQSQGATGAGTNNIAVFPNSNAGFQAMDQLVQQYAGQGYNLGQLINVWAPGNAPGNTPQSTQNYINYVSGKTGSNPSTPLTGLQQGNQILANAGGLLGAIAGSAYGNPAAGAISGATAGVTASQTAKPFSLNLFPDWTLGRVVAVVLGLIMVGLALGAFAFLGAGKAIDVILGTHGQVQKGVKAASIVKSGAEILA